jgi:hypothetical protein
MAITAFRVALDPVDPALAPSGGVAFAPGAPARSLGHPADLSFAHRTSYPITAPFFY